MVDKDNELRESITALVNNGLKHLTTHDKSGIMRMTGAEFLITEDFLKLITERESKLVREKLIQFANDIKKYDWQLEDSINANDVVAVNVDYELAEALNQLQKEYL